MTPSLCHASAVALVTLESDLRYSDLSRMSVFLTDPNARKHKSCSKTSRQLYSYIVLLSQLRGLQFDPKLEFKLVSV